MNADTAGRRFLYGGKICMVIGPCKNPTRKKGDPPMSRTCNLWAVKIDERGAPVSAMFQVPDHLTWTPVSESSAEHA